MVMVNEETDKIKHEVTSEESPVQPENTGVEEASPAQKPELTENQSVEENPTEIKPEEPPVEEEIAPVEEEAPPVEEEATPLEEQAPPVEEEAAPLEEEAAVNFDLLDTEGRWLLKVLSGPNMGAEFAMHGGSAYLIGTDTHQCDIVFQDLSVSRKHARLLIDLKDNALLEDLKSRNGTFVDGTRIEKKEITGNALITMGTTTFMLVDREAESTTIVAPSHYERKEEPLPAAPIHEIEEATFPTIQEEVKRVKAKEEEQKKEQASQAMSSLIILAVITAFILAIGVGTALLFRAEEVTAPKVLNPEDEIADALKEFPEIRYSYNPSNSRLLLVGHVLTSTDRSKMLDLLQRLRFIRVIDYSNVVIDEHVWREANQILSKNPAWRGITITSPRAGRYVLSGFLKSRDEAEELYDYISQNFEYVNLLERKVVVEEELLSQVQRELNNSGFRGVKPDLVGSDLSLTGTIPNGEMAKFDKLLNVFKALPGIRSVQSFVSEGGVAASVIDLTGKYRISGYSQYGDTASVVINGRILAPGDSFDGMTIVEISPTTIFLEKDSVKYKIDFNQ